MSWFDTPDVPSATDTARAQTGTNVSTAVANAYLNNVNQSTPTGNLNYSATGSHQWTDPSTGSTYTIPTFTASQTQTPAQQAIFNNTQAAQTNLSQMARTQSGILRDTLGRPFNAASGVPAAGGANLLSSTPQAGSTIAEVGPQQRGFAEAGDVTRSYGPGDFSADRNRVEESLYQRMDPQLQRDRSAMEARLADQGIMMGSPGYQAAMDQFNRQLTDTRLGITQTAGQEQQRMTEMAAQRAGFQNAAQQQAYQQALGRGTFANQAQAQDFQQAALRSQFANTAAAQNLTRGQAIFGAMNTARNQQISENYAQRNQPLNEISALLSGSQVSSPNWVSANNNQISTTDVAGLINNQFSQQMQSYQQQNNNFNQLMGGIFGALGGVVSDRREKEDIDRIGTVFAAGEDGEKPLPLYAYAYKDDPTETRHMGPMAQDVEKISPKAVKTRKGVKYLDRTKFGSILRV